MKILSPQSSLGLNLITAIEVPDMVISQKKHKQDLQDIPAM